MLDVETAREFDRFRLSNGLKELALIAPTTREAVVAVASKNMPGLMVDRAFLLGMGVPKDSMDKVMQVYRSCYGNIPSRGNWINEPHHHN